MVMISKVAVVVIVVLVVVVGGGVVVIVVVCMCVCVCAHATIPVRMKQVTWLSASRSGLFDSISSRRHIGHLLTRIITTTMLTTSSAISKI